MVVRNTLDLRMLKGAEVVVARDIPYLKVFMDSEEAMMASGT